MRPRLLSEADLPLEPQQKRSRDKRARLKAAALALFGEKGYEGTSIQEIAGRAQLAVGGFYQHFRSKRQLLLVLMDELLEGLSRVNLNSRTPGTTTIRQAIRDLLGHAFAHDLRYIGAYRAWREAVLSDAELARHDVHMHAWTTARVAALFDALHKLPGTRVEADIEALSRLMDGMFWAILSEAPSMSEPELERQLDAAVHLIYHAIFADHVILGNREHQDKGG